MQVIDLGDVVTALNMLFSTDYGLMSLGVIVFVIVIGAYLGVKFKKLSQQRPEDQQW